MKKGLLILIVLSALLVICFSATALAAGVGPHKGPGFAADTDGCAGCHRAHTGVQAKLLKSGTNRYSFCTACHNGTGANANVVSGEFEGTGTPNPAAKGWDSEDFGTASAGLNGGGFEKAAPYTGRSGRMDTLVSLTGDLQRHNVVGTGEEAAALSYGGGDGTSASGGVNTTEGFSCTSCHDPHGLNNDGGSVERYRMLKGTDAVRVNGVNTSSAITSNETTRDYTTTQYKAGMADFCIACHTQYKTLKGTVGAGATGTGETGTYNANALAVSGSDTAKVRFRHNIDVALSTNTSGGNIKGTGNSVQENVDGYDGGKKLPLERTTGTGDATLPTDEITCLTCHQSHGTAAAMDANASVAPANSSTLLRFKNRGVCQACHKK